ncbi:DUF5412 family protein [Gottfriedia sp. OAE603]|uniref:DUF5412 family protein n=1 Tax=Gottfriedia sp. OAE603 TaxID=2663872 RepID=UPI00178B7824
MKKEKIILYSIISIVVSACIGFVYFFNSKQTNSISDLKNVNVAKLDKIEELESPNKKQKLTIYLAGGVLLKSDYSYIGQLTSKDNKKKGKFILWLSSEPYNVRWINNKEILVNEKQININSEIYDFRNM